MFSTTNLCDIRNWSSNLHILAYEDMMINIRVVLAGIPVAYLTDPSFKIRQKHQLSARNFSHPSGVHPCHGH